MSDILAAALQVAEAVPDASKSDEPGTAFAPAVQIEGGSAP